MKPSKPALEKGSITKTISAEITATLLKDFDRFSNGLISMNATNATFKVNGEEGNVGVDLGGTKIEVTIGHRGWSFDIADIVGAAVLADKAYLETAGPSLAE